MKFVGRFSLAIALLFLSIVVAIGFRDIKAAVEILSSVAAPIGIMLGLGLAIAFDKDED